MVLNDLKQILREVLYFTKDNLHSMLKIIGPLVLLYICVGVPLEFLGDDVLVKRIYSFAINIIQPFYFCRLIKYMNNSATSNTLSLDVSFKEWLNLLIVYLLYGVAVILGCFVFVVPGIYLAARYGFAEFEAVLNRKQPIQSLNDSWESTKSHTSTLIMGSIIIVVPALIVFLLLGFIGEINTMISVLTKLISEILSILLMVFITVFYFRVYLLHSQSLTTPSN